MGGGGSAVVHCRVENSSIYYCLLKWYYLLKYINVENMEILH